MNTKYLVLSREDFGRDISLSWATDVMDCFGDADWEATQSIKDGSRETYVFKLEKVYVDRESSKHIVEQVLVENEKESDGTAQN